jgi:hypothetical protein
MTDRSVNHFACDKSISLELPELMERPVASAPTRSGTYHTGRVGGASKNGIPATDLISQCSSSGGGGMIPSASDNESLTIASSSSMAPKHDTLAAGLMLRGFRCLPLTHALHTGTQVVTTSD